MLSESIVAEQNAVLRAVGYHVVGPVQHRHGHKSKFTAAEAYFVAFLNNHKVKAVTVMAQSLVFAMHGNNKFSIGSRF